MHAVLLLLLVTGALVLPRAPALAAPAATPVVYLYEPSAVRAGEAISFDVSVSLPDRAEDDTTTYLSDWPVRVSAVDGSWTSETATTDDGGFASITVTRPAAEDTQVVAELVADGCDAVRSAPVRASWYAWAFELEPAGDFATDSDQTASLTARLVRSDGAEVFTPDPYIFTFAPFGGRPIDPYPVAPDGGGDSQTVRWGRPEDGTTGEVITVSGVDSDGKEVVAAPITHTWREVGGEIGRVRPRPHRTDPRPVHERAGNAKASAQPPPLDAAVTVLGSAGQTRAGDPLRVRVVVVVPGDVQSNDRIDPDAPNAIRLSGVPVRLDAGGGASATGTTGEDGSVVLTVTRRTAGRQTLTAHVDALGCSVDLDGPRHTWWLPTLTLDPDAASSVVGSTASVEARLTHDGDGLGGRALRWTTTAPGRPERTGTVTTNTNGRAVLPGWTRSSTGTDTIRVQELGPEVPVSAVGTHRWTEGEGGGPPPATRPPEGPGSPASPPTTEPPTTPTETETTPTGSETTEPPVTDPPVTPPPRTTADPERPGGDVVVNGTGCAAGAAVRASVGSRELGATTAGPDGTFSMRAPLPDLPLGRYSVTSTCGALTSARVIDVSAPQAHGGRAAAAGTTVATFLLFFVLVGNAALRVVKTG